jgi:hypothetical protein
VRGFRPGAQAAAWARLLDELATAKACFSDPARKSAYDDSVRQASSRPRTVEPLRSPQQHVAPVNVSPDRYPPGMAPVFEAIPAATHAKTRPPAPAVPPPIGTNSPSQVPVSEAAVDRNRGTVREPVPPGPVNAHVAPPRQEPVSLLPLTAIVASVVIVLTVIILAIALRDDAGGSALVPHSPLPSSPAASSPSVAKQDAPAVPMMPAGDPPATEPETVPADPPSPPTPDSTPPNSDVPPTSADSPPSSEDLAQLAKLLQQARSAIAVHQFRAADEALQKATAVATTAEHQALVSRLQRLGQCADEFWSAVTTAASKLRALEEIKIGSGNMLVIVVENGGDSITIRNQGRNTAYSLADLPAGLALAIARRGMNEDDPQTQVLFGAGLVTAKDVKPSHIDEARRYWERAEASGADVEDLQATLTDSYELTQ